MPEDFGPDWARDHFTAPSIDGTLEVTWPVLDADADIICALGPDDWAAIAAAARADTRVAQALHAALWDALDERVHAARRPAAPVSA